MVDRDRLANTFKSLVKIDSVSKEEAKISKKIRTIFESLGGTVFEDGAGKKIGGNAGNLIIKFKGNTKTEPLLLNAHMDTVEPGKGIEPVIHNGIFTSSGDTILGADDKSAIAILIELMRILTEGDAKYGPIEIVMTVCEEIGLLGAKNLDFDQLTAKFGYSLDATDTEGIVVQAPAVNRLKFQIHGKDAHAGAAPEKGINAIVLAGKAIANLEIGRIDRETTCNIGIIEGGKAINVVPKLVTIKGEVRSHDMSKLDRVTESIVSSFKTVIEDYRKNNGEGELPRLDISILREFPNTNIPDGHPVVKLAQQAAGNIGRKMRTKATGGGADANIFFGKGIMTGVLGTGMRDMHTVREWIPVDDMVKATELLLEIIRLHSINGQSV